MDSLIVHVIIINTLDLFGVLAAKYWSITKNPWLLLVTSLLFAGAGFFFARSLRFEGVAIVNIVWITISVVLVTLIGYFFFKEQITPRQLAGIFAILIGLVLVNWR